MRWNSKPRENERIIRRFLITPRCIDNEWRWGEWATIKQARRYTYSIVLDMKLSEWYDIAWIN